MPGIEHRKLAAEADRSTGDQRSSVFNARTIDGVSCGEIVATIKYDVGAGDQRVELFASESIRNRLDGHFGVDSRQSSLSG